MGRYRGDWLVACTGRYKRKGATTIEVGRLGGANGCYWLITGGLVGLTNGAMGDGVVAKE